MIYIQWSMHLTVLASIVVRIKQRIEYETE